MQLFRDEAAAAGAAQWLGTVRLHRSASAVSVTVTAVAVAGLLISFAFWGDIQRKNRLSGVLVPALGSLSIPAPQAGQISRLPISEGATVRAGEVLFVIETQRQDFDAGQIRDKTVRLQQQITSRRTSLRAEREQREHQARQREDVLRGRIRNLELSLDEAQQEMAIQQRRVELARSARSRIEKLAHDGFVSEAQTQAKFDELLEATAKVKTLNRSRLAVEGDLQAMRGELDDVRTSLAAEVQQFERAAALIEQEEVENSSTRTQVVTAQVDGTVTALEYRSGQPVQQGQTVLTLVPSRAGTRATLEAHLFAPSHAVGFVATGQRVYLRYAAYPFEKFGVYAGKVRTVSSSPFSLTDLPANLTQQLSTRAVPQEPVYRVIVDLESQDVHAYGQAIPLKTGMSVEADAIGRRQKIWEWLFAPILAARRQLLTLGMEST